MVHSDALCDSDRGDGTKDSSLACPSHLLLSLELDLRGILCCAQPRRILAIHRLQLLDEGLAPARQLLLVLDQPSRTHTHTHTHTHNRTISQRKPAYLCIKFLHSFIRSPSLNDTHTHTHARTVTLLARQTGR